MRELMSIQVASHMLVNQLAGSFRVSWLDRRSICCLDHARGLEQQTNARGGCGWVRELCVVGSGVAGSERLSDLKKIRIRQMGYCSDKWKRNQAWNGNYRISQALLSSSDHQARLVSCRTSSVNCLGVAIVQQRSRQQFLLRTSLLAWEEGFPSLPSGAPGSGILAAYISSWSMWVL